MTMIIRSLSLQCTLAFILGTLSTIPTVTAQSSSCPLDKFPTATPTTTPTTTPEVGDESSTQSYCPADAPPGGCPNGLWSYNLCTCQCIAPFCTSGDGGTTCAINGSCMQTSNHWENCVRGIDCPYWRSITAHNSCATGPDVPAGIYNLYHTNQECCDEEFPDWGTCLSNAEAEYVLQDIEYPVLAQHYVPIKFQVKPQGDDVNKDELNAEMLDILQQVLFDLDETCGGRLDISGVEENVVRASQTVENEDDDGELYYNIKLQDGVGGEELSELSSALMEGLEDSKEVISQHIEAEVANVESFDYDVNLDPDAWKTTVPTVGPSIDPDAWRQKEPEEVEVVSSKQYRVKIRLEDLPNKELDYEKLKRHIIGVYQSLLQGGNIEELDIIGIEGGGGNIFYRDGSTAVRVVFGMDVLVAPTSGQAALTNVLSSKEFKNDVLIGIQSYTDSLSTDHDMDWCIDDDEEDDDGAYAYSAVCSQSSTSTSSFKLPLWAAITLSAFCIILCFFCWFLMAARRKQQKTRQRSSMRQQKTWQQKRRSTYSSSST